MLTDERIHELANALVDTLVQPTPTYRDSRTVIGAAIRAAIEEATRWIPVGEALPPAGQTVLVWRDELPPETPPLVAFWTGQTWCHQVMGYTLVVDRWQPLPPGPQEVTEIP